MIIEETENTQPITKLYAFLSIDENGNEGICSFRIDGQNFPLIFGHESTIEKGKSMATHLNKMTGQKIRLIKFERYEVMETFGE